MSQIKYYILYCILVVAVNATKGQHAVNPGRPSFSENNHIVSPGGLQAESGFSSIEDDNLIAYSFNSLVRMGFHSRWEGRIFSGLETIRTDEEIRSSIEANGVGAGLKFLMLKESDSRPSIGLLTQSSFFPTDLTSHSVSVLMAKEFSSLAVDLNVNAIFKGHHFVSVGYIACAAYSIGKASVFMEGMFTNNRNVAMDEIWLQGGVSWAFNSKWQIDFAAASFGSRFSNQMLQLGFTFLVLSKRREY